MQFAVKPCLTRIWHAPEHFELMDPLPPLHRRGIILGALLMVIGFLLPSTDSPHRINGEEALATTPPISTPALKPQGKNSDPAPARVDEAPVLDDTFSSITDKDDTNESARQLPRILAPAEVDQQWHSYRVQSGQTLAQLFRDRRLPVNDAYALAKAEGEDKPLSNLQNGQVVKIRQNANGVVTGVMVEAGGKQILFTRQANGSFLRPR